MTSRHVNDTPHLSSTPRASLAVWCAATRPRTLAASFAPVLVGTALAFHTTKTIHWLDAWACLLGAILLQIGSNFANDAFDGIKGADTPDRLGPQRAVATGLISARAMLFAAAIVLGLALIVGLYLTWLGGWPIGALAVISLICSVAYTGGPFPLAYHGLGDLFVFLFFGLLAVLGTAWILTANNAAMPALYPNAESLFFGLPSSWCLVAAALGLQATSIIAVNNLRDIVTDTKAHKRTIAVRIGDRLSRWYIVGLHLVSVVLFTAASRQFSGVFFWIVPLVAGIGGLFFCIGMFRAQGRELNGFLARSAALELITAVTCAIVLML